MVKTNTFYKRMIIVFFLIAVSASQSFAERTFSVRYTTNLQGNVKVIGNAILSAADDGSSSNAQSPLRYIDVDGVGTTFNSSQATLQDSVITDPTKTRVIWAGLYWQSYLHRWDPNDGTSNNNPYRNTNWTSAQIQNTITTQSIRFTTPAGTYTINPDVVDIQNNPSSQNSVNYPGVTYSCFENVTALLQNNPLGTYTVANIPSQEGQTYNGGNGGTVDGLGNFGAWALVVVYENTLDPKMRNISINDGYQVIASATNPNVNIAISGFKTPLSGVVDSSLSVFAGEGDRYIAGDTLSVTNQNGTSFTFPPLVGNNNFFSSSIQGVDSRNPTIANNNGIDIQTVQMGDASGGPGIIGNDETSATVSLNTTGDTYFPSVVVVATELYRPKLCYDYSLKQDGKYLSIDRTTDPTPRIEQSQLKVGSPVELMVYLKNKEADFVLEGVSLKSDLNGTHFGDMLNDKIYSSNPNGSALLDRNVPLLNTPVDCNYSTASGNALTNQGCTRYFDNNLSTLDDDIRRIRKGVGDIKSEEFIYTKFNLHPNLSSSTEIGDFNQSLGLSLDYYITVNGNIIRYSGYSLGGVDVPMCIPTSGYTPSLGTFNVVHHSSTATPNTTNNLKTQISRKPFDVDLIFDGIPTTWTNDKPTASVSSTVQVEMIDVDSFGDINASCQNPDAAVSKAIFVPFSFTSAAAPAYQTLIAKQNSDYHNFAVSNGAFRIWYFADKNNNLRIWKPTGLSDFNKTISGIDSTGALYDSASHPSCTTSCGTATSMTCFNCMKENYAKALCSRDNFSVRPEAFDIRIKDYNTTAVNDLSHDVYGTSPDKNTTTVPATQPRMNLAAGYEYKLDFTATGYEQNSSAFVPVPLYKRHFNGTDTSASIRMDWNSTLTAAECNNVSGKDLSTSLYGGVKTDLIEFNNQIGDYRLYMFDKGWTRVDQINRIVGNGFIGGTDCVINSNSSVADAFGRYGCDIVSEHTNGSYKYKDQNITFKPAKFDLSSITYGVGKNKAGISAGGTQFVYMANLDNGEEMNMSLRASGKIKAVGANGATLSNFVTGCFARDLTMNFENNATLGLAGLALLGRVENRSPLNNALLYDVNLSETNTTAFKVVDDSNFTKVNNGELNSTIRLNFTRDSVMPRAPENIVYGDFNITCVSASDCNVSSMREDVNRVTPGIVRGKSDMDFTLTHLYGRLFTQNVRSTANAEFDALGRYEVYQSPTLIVDGITNTLTPNSTDTNWYLNKMHDSEARDGNSSMTYIEKSFPLPSSSIYDTNGTKTYHFTGYGTRGTYKVHMDVDPWLWYEPVNMKAYKDPANPANLDCNTHPCFDIRIGSLIGRSGSAETVSEETKDNKDSKSTGQWKTHNDYAPAIR